MTDMTERTTLADAVRTTIASLDPTAREGIDAGACALAVLLAEEIDGAGRVARHLAGVARAVREEFGLESALYEEVQALTAKLAERTALERLGARLQASLESLCAVPKARGKAALPPKPGSSALDELRARRDAS